MTHLLNAAISDSTKQAYRRAILTYADFSKLHFPTYPLQWAGLDPTKYKAHSFRIGAATTAADMGMSETHIQLMGRWKSTAFRRYIRIPMLQMNRPRP